MKKAEGAPVWSEEIEAQIRSGEVGAAKQLLATALKEQKSREDSVRLANFSRRLGDLPEALRLLNRVVRPPARNPIVATDEEKAEYAAALAESGGNREAIDILQGIDSEALAQALLFAAFAHMGRWEYSEAIPLLERYIAHPELSDYQRIVGKVNLLSAFGYEDRLEELESLSQRLWSEVSETGSPFLKAATLEAWAECLILEGKSTEGLEKLEEARKLLPDTDTLLGTFIEKWTYIGRQRNGEPLDEFVQKMKQLRARSVERGFWETVRDCDYQLACALGDLSIFRRLYFGTPFEGYRNRILRSARKYVPGFDGAMGNSYDWKPGFELEGRSGEAPMLDVKAGEFSGGGEALKPGQIPHRLLNILSSDFYKPMSIASVHAELFPERYYNPETSPELVRNASIRLQAWFDEQRIPLRIDREAGLYNLTAPGACILRVQTQVAPSVNLDPKLVEHLHLIGLEFGDTPFTTQQAADLLRLSRRSMQRYLQQLLESQVLVQEGSGRKTRFKVAKI